jgi:hypothetical protein
MTGDHHHLGGGARFQVVHQLYAASVGQLQVAQHDVGLQPGHVDTGGAQAVGGCHAEAFGLGELREPLDGFGIVVYEEEMGHRGRSIYRSVVIPPARNLRTSMR